MADETYKPAPEGTKQEACFIEPSTIFTFWKRLPELVTDPSCNQLSTSRLVLFLCGCCTVALTWAAIVMGRIEAVTGLIPAIAGIAAGVYFASTVKDWRWRRREDLEGPQ